MGLTTPRVKHNSLAPIWAMGGQGPTFAGDAGDIADACGLTPALTRGGPGTTWVAYPSGKTLSFDGSSSASGTGAPIDYYGDFTIAISLYVPSSNISNTVFACQGGYGGGGFYLQHDYSSMTPLTILTYFNATPVFSPVHSLDRWFRLVTTLQAGTATSWVDGIPGSAVSGINLRPPSPSILFLGDYSIPGYRGPCQIANLQIFNRAFSPQEVAEDVANPNRIFTSRTRTRRRYYSVGSTVAGVIFRRSLTSRIGSRGTN
jgi:hypothetical protein